MADNRPMERRVYSVRRILVCLLSGILLLTFASFLIMHSYLSTPRAAARVSARLSGLLALSVTISGMKLKGDTLVCTGVEIANPSGFPGSALLSVGTLAVAPGWSGILRGKRTLRLLELDGITLGILKGTDGAWNVDSIRKRFSGGGGGAELYIGDLKIRNGSILVDGRGVRGISFTLRDLATKGSSTSRVNLNFSDEAGNRYLAEGSFNLGKEPEMKFSLDAPSLSVGPLAEMVKIRGGPAFSGGKGHARIQAALHKGIVRSETEVVVSGLHAKAAQGADVPITGSLKAAAAYDSKGDRLSLDSLTLKIEDMVSLHARGNASNLKSSLKFDADLGVDRLDLKGVAAFLPIGASPAVVLGGRVESGRIKFSGGRTEGLRAVQGRASLRDFMLSRGDRSFIDGLHAAVTLSTVNSLIVGKGELIQEQPKGKALLGTINAPFTISVTSALKPQTVDIAGLTATVMGVPVTGRINYRAQAKDPLSISVQVPESSVKGMSALGTAGFAIDSGTAGMSLDLKGSGATVFRGTASLSVNALKGNVRGENFAVGKSAVTAVFKRVAGLFAASGNTEIKGISFKGASAGGRAGFRLADGLLHIEHSEITVADTDIKIEELVASLPLKRSRAGPMGYPVDMRFAGGEIRRGEVRLAGVSGSAAGAYSADVTGKWIDGLLCISAGKILWRGQEVGSPAVRISFSRPGGNGRVEGTALGGTMAGDFSFDPFTPAKGVSFNLALNKADVARSSLLAGNKGKVTLSNGLLNLHAAGSYSGQSGLDCRLNGRGAGVAVSGEGGRRLISDTTLQFDGSIAHGRLVLADALLTAGEGVALTMKGEIGNVFTPMREGAVSFSLQRAPLSKIVDPVATALPRFLQEGSLYGDMAAEAVLGLRNGHTRLEGVVRFDGAGVDAESKKIKITGITGKIPLSVDFSGTQRGIPGDTADFKREEFDRYLQKFKKAPDDALLLKIARIGVGPLEFGETALHLKGANGVTDVMAISSSLNSGLFTGSAVISLGGGVGYGAEVLVTNLSLNQLCSAFPKIKGYVSGRVDGIMRLSGRSGGISNLDGHTFFWTREGDGEKMLVSREFLQRLAGKNLQGFFFRDDRPFDRGEVRASLSGGYLSFDLLDISHTNIFGIRDLSVSVAETQNRIALEHLLDSITQAASRGKGEAAPRSPVEAAPVPEFKWDE